MLLLLYGYMLLPPLPLIADAIVYVTRRLRYAEALPHDKRRLRAATLICFRR